MSKQHGVAGRSWQRGTALWTMAAALCLTGCAAQKQQPASPPTAPPIQASDHARSQPQAQTRITPAQAIRLFSLVDDLLKFSSEETGLPIKSTVKRQLTTRADVEAYLKQKFQEDEGAKRLQRDEIVLKKFGLLDRDFALQPFLLALLDEQIEAYYDSKTKTVNLLDWVDVEEQKPVLAHELTHALQDQHTDLEKWNGQTPDDVSIDSDGDTEHLAKDELDTARDAVVEGQATAVMMDYILKPLGKSLIKDPEVSEFVKQQMAGASDSPVLARAPLLLSESLIFPYREGLSFEQDLWMDNGREAAFAGAMDRPPTSTWEIINPREYERRRVPAIPLLPDIHPLVDKLYMPYDIGQVGQLDLHILAELYGGDSTARDLTPAWDGGIYWAGQLLAPQTPIQKSGTGSLALFYLSVWKNHASAQAFAQLYSDNLGRKYSGLKQIAVNENQSAGAAGPGSPRTGLGPRGGDPGSPRTGLGPRGGDPGSGTWARSPKLQPPSGPAPPASTQDLEEIFTTTEGPVLITTRGKLVFVAESFPLPLARQLTALILDAQGSGELKMASTSLAQPQTPRAPSFGLLTGEKVGEHSSEPLTANLIRFLSNCGVMKAAVTAAIHAGN